MRAHCAICTDKFETENTITSTPCGHVFHEVCVLQWIEHSRTCPECRQHCTDKKLKRIYFNFNDKETLLSAEQFGNKLADAKSELLSTKTELSLKKKEIIEVQENASKLKCLTIKAENEALQFKHSYYDVKSSEAALKIQLKQTLKELSIMKNISEENKHLRNEINHLKNVEGILKGSEGEIDEILASYGSQNEKQMATYLTLLKRELLKSRDDKRELQNEMKQLKRQLGFQKSDLSEKNMKIKSLTNDICQLRTEKDILETERGDHSQPTDFESAKKLGKMLLIKEEHDPTPPSKKPKINMVHTFVNKLKDRDTISKGSNLPSYPMKKSLFRNDSDESDSESAIREGFNGLGSHSKFIIRSAPIQMKMTRKVQHPNKKQSNTLKNFIK